MAKHPRNYRDAKSPLTQNLMAHKNFEIREVPYDIQIRKLKLKMEKTAKQIKNLIERMSREPSRQAEFQHKLVHRNEVYLWQQTRANLLQDKLDSQIRKEKTAKENLAKEMQAHIANLEKIKPVNPFKDGLDSFKPVPKKEMEVAKKPKVKRVKNTIVQVKQKRWSLK